MKGNFQLQLFMQQYLQKEHNIDIVELIMQWLLGRRMSNYSHAHPSLLHEFVLIDFCFV